MTDWPVNRPVTSASCRLSTEVTLGTHAHESRRSVCIHDPFTVGTTIRPHVFGDGTVHLVCVCCRAQAFSTFTPESLYRRQIGAVDTTQWMAEQIRNTHDIDYENGGGCKPTCSACAVTNSTQQAESRQGPQQLIGKEERVGEPTLMPMSGDIMGHNAGTRSR